MPDLKDPRCHWISQNTKGPVFILVLYTDWSTQRKGLVVQDEVHALCHTHPCRIVGRLSKARMTQINTKVDASRRMAVPTLWSLSTSEALKPSSLSLAGSDPPPNVFSQWEPSPQLLPLSTSAPSPALSTGLLLYASDYLISGSQPRWEGGWLKGWEFIEADGWEWQPHRKEEQRGCSQWEGDRVSAERKVESAASQLSCLYLSLLQGHQVQEEQETTTRSWFTYGNLTMMSF